MKIKINRENALKFWKLKYGNKNETTDFAGRQIKKGAYGDKTNKFGRNIDHILPKSSGGESIENNLIITNILTNSEKKNDYPAFEANNKKFKIIKEKDKFIIKEIPSNVELKKISHTINVFNNLNTRKNQCTLQSSILIRFKNLTNNNLIDFIFMIFKNENKTIQEITINNKKELRITIKSFDPLNKDKIKSLFNKCLSLDDDLKAYFKSLNIFESYEIRYKVESIFDYKRIYKTYSADVFKGIDGKFNNQFLVNNSLLELIDQTPENPFGGYNVYKK